jgi:AhpD family alkylhydroperoxidase
LIQLMSLCTRRALPTAEARARHRKEPNMDARTKELVAMGAAAAANCHPCMDHHLAKCDELGIQRDEVAEAVKVGLVVNHGAEGAIRKHARKLLGDAMVEGGAASIRRD